MVINFDKFVIYLLESRDQFRCIFSPLFEFSIQEMGEGFKYLGFNLKPNNYGAGDLNWIVSQIDKRIQF
jgi:hypothetical protein